MKAPTEAQSARDDLAFIQQVVARTDRRIDPHAFHFVHWGLIVLVWYPLSNYLALEKRMTGVLWVGIGAFVLGMALSTLREAFLARKTRLPGENTFIGRQVATATLLSVGAGVILSAVGPATGFIEGPEVPTLWGLVYANLAVMVGVMYRREFLWSGVVIFASAICAMAFSRYNGFILGPVMGLGLIVPGVMAERRVKALRKDARGD